jgi:ubiquinone/menaquinone biosynthesis C-methylase UbiE
MARNGRHCERDGLSVSGLVRSTERLNVQGVTMGHRPLVAREFVQWLAVPVGRDWLDIGSGTGR